ncbi:MAG TPA: DUF4345 domain-containing protein [Rhizomicrobium sp.]|nr:DUF4345 domain-containing protein [Rhizomicrobium sp.]
MNPEPVSPIERRLLQIAVAVGGLVPVGAGLSGALRGASFLDVATSVSTDSHIRYLSGLLLGIGLAFWISIPRIERHAARFQLLAAIVVLGGCARLLALTDGGKQGSSMYFALAMELLVTPALFLWQRRVARAYGTL